MRNRFRLLLIPFALVVTAFAGASTAQASYGIALSDTVIGASGSLTMNGVITCDVLLSITANRIKISKTTGINQATASGGFIRNCTGSLVGRPNTGTIGSGINLQYRSFAGTLPNITRVNLLAPNAAFSVNTIAGVCAYGGSLDGLGVDISSRTVSGVDFSSTSSLPRTSGSVLCPSTAQMRGRLTTFLPSAPEVVLANQADDLISISSPGAISLSSSSVSFDGGAGTITCTNVSLDGSVTGGPFRTGDTIGGITRAVFAGCPGGTIITPLIGEWPIKADDVTKEKLKITNIKITITVSLLIEDMPNLRCLYSGPVDALVLFNPNPGNPVSGTGFAIGPAIGKNIIAPFANLAAPVPAPTINCKNPAVGNNFTGLFNWATPKDWSVSF